MAKRLLPPSFLVPILVLISQGEGGGTFLQAIHCRCSSLLYITQVKASHTSWIGCVFLSTYYEINRRDNIRGTATNTGQAGEVSVLCSLLVCGESLSAGEYSHTETTGSSYGVTLLSRCLGHSQCRLSVCVLPLTHRLSHSPSQEQVPHLVWFWTVPHGTVKGTRRQKHKFDWNGITHEKRHDNFARSPNWKLKIVCKKLNFILKK